jgi:hypothetical protein
MERGPSRSEHSLINAPAQEAALRTDREVDRSVDLGFLVVSELHRRGLFRREYQDSSLRDHFSASPVPAPMARRGLVGAA